MFGRSRKEKGKGEVPGQAGKSYRGGTRDRLDLVQPDSIQERPKDILIDGKRYMRLFFVDQIRAELHVRSLFTILAQAEDIDLSVHLEPADVARVIRILNNDITTLQAQMIHDEKRGYIQDMPLHQRALEEKMRLREELQLGRERLFHGTIVFAVSSENPEELDRAEKTILERLDAYGFKARVAVARQADALRTLLPFASERLLHAYRNLNIGGVSCMFPVFGDEFSHPDGIFIGYTNESGNPVFLNLHQGPPALLNPHMGVFATSGAGKTTFLRALIARSAVYGVRQVVIDAEGDYQPLEDFADTEVVRVEPDSHGLINPFDLEPDGGLLNLNEKRLDIQALVLAMAAWNDVRLGVGERDLVDRAVKELYEERGITKEEGSLYAGASVRSEEGIRVGRIRKEMPTLLDLWNKVRDHPVLGKLLRQYTREGPLGAFDGQTSVDLNKPLVIFDISRLEERVMRPLAMHILLEWIWERFVKGQPGRKQVLIDEAWLFMQHDDSADFLANMAARARKRGTALIVATQRFEHFATEKGATVLANLDTVALMKQAPQELDKVAEAFHLSEGQRMQLAEIGEPGEMLLRSGGSVARSNGTMVRLQVSLFPFEEALKVPQPTLET